MGKAQDSSFYKAKTFSNIDSSVSYFQKKLIALEQTRDTISIIATCNYLATAHTLKSEYTRAKKIIAKGLNIALQKKDHTSVGLLYLKLANALKYEGNYPEALKTYLKASDIFEAKSDWKNLLTACIDLAEYYRKIAKYTEAKNYINKALTIYHNKKISDTSQLIRIYNRLAAIKVENVDSVIHYSQLAIKLSRQINDKNSEAISLNELGFTLKNMLQLDSALKCLRQAEQLWSSIGANREAAHAIYNQALVLTHNNYPKKQSIELYYKLINLVKLKKVDYPLDEVYGYLSFIFHSSGDSMTGYKWREKHLLALIEKNQKIYNFEIDKISEKYDNDKIKKEIESVSNKLIETEELVNQKKRENNLITVFLLILTLLIALALYLLYQRNKSNRALQLKAKEKDALIQEIHHRVKNNLQFVSSLINMQINSTSNPKEEDSLNDASRRIRAMALVHEMLYNQDGIDGVLINQYLSELTKSINDLVNSSDLPIEFSLQVDDLIFDAQKAIALGMITSELISNSIKYAFEGVVNPKIHVTLIKKNKIIEYSVKDNGNGNKIINEVENGKKLGMRLINIFSRQLKGEFDLENQEGFKYSITFNA